MHGFGSPHTRMNRSSAAASTHPTRRYSLAACCTTYANVKPVIFWPSGLIVVGVSLMFTMLSCSPRMSFEKRVIGSPPPANGGRITVGGNSGGSTPGPCCGVTGAAGIALLPLVGCWCAAAGLEGLVVGWCLGCAGVPLAAAGVEARLAAPGAAAPGPWGLAAVLRLGTAAAGFVAAAGVWLPAGRLGTAF